MFKKVETTVESTSGEPETSQLTANSGDVKTKPEKPKRKFVASLKSNIRQLGSSVVGLKMSKQQKPGSFTDSTQSSELKKKKNKKQKEELGPSLSTDSEQSVGAKPKASKVAANLVKKLSVDKIYQPFIGQQYTGSNVKTSVTSSSTGPTPPESDVKSTSSSEISYESPIHAPKDRLEEVNTKEQTTAGSTTAEVGKDETTKPVILEDLILQTQQFAESLASPDKPGKNLLAEFIEAESKSNSKKSDDKITNKDVKSQIETKLSEKNDNKIKDQDHKNKTVNLSRDESKDSKSEKLQEENKKKSDKQEKIIESDKERKAKEDQDKVDSKGDKTEPPAQVERKPQKKDESKVSVKTNPSSKPEVDLNIEKNSTKSDTEKHQMPASGDKLKQQKFAEHEKQSVIKETEENRDANKQNKLTLDGNKSEKRKSVQDGDEKETKHIKIEQDKDTEKGKTQKGKYEKEGTQNEKTGTEKDEKENTQIQKIQDKDDKKNTQNEKTVTEKGDKENTQIEKNQEKDDKGNIQNEKDKIENTKTDTNIMKEEEGKPVDESVSTTSLDIKTPQSSANAVIDNTSKNLPSELVESDKVTTPTLDGTIINPLDDPSTFISGKSENTPGSSHDSTFPLPDRSSSPKETSTIMSQVPEKRECLYKILVIGELGTGKTSIIKRYVHQFFSQHYRATIGVDFALKVLNWDPNTIIRLQLWDIAGQERFGNMTRVYYKEAVGAFIVFDVTRSATFDAVLKWKQDLDAKVQLADGASIPCVLLANKCDQQKEGIINNPARMEEYCKEHNFSGWFETSAKENINIDEAAKSLVTQILQNDKVSQNGRDIRDGSKFPLDGKGEQQESKSCSC